nr:DUF5753 domain-containing protein [Fodinicola acaciae]
MDWILNEAVIRRVVGSREVMADQLHHLATFDTNANLSIRVLPYAAGAHTAMIGPFDILEFPKDSEPTTVHIDGLTGSLYLEKEKEIHAYRRIFEKQQQRSAQPKRVARPDLANREGVQQCLTFPVSGGARAVAPAAKAASVSRSPVTAADAK